MTVPVQSTIFEHVANGLSGDFAYGCLVFESDDIVVTINGAVITGGYTISGLGNSLGGMVTILPIPVTGTLVTIQRIIKLERENDYQQVGEFRATTVNTDFDRVWMALQQQGGALALSPDSAGIGYDARQHRIINVSDPINPQDASNKRWVQSEIGHLLTDGTGQYVLDMIAAPDGAARVGYGASTVKASLDTLTPAVAANAANLVTQFKQFRGEEYPRLSPRPVMRPNRAMKNAIAAGTIKVVIVGDSISEGASLFYPNTYAQNLTQMLVREVPYITWNIVNLSIGGFGMGNLADSAFVAPTSFDRPRNSNYDASQVWPNGSVNGKSWRDHVKDEAPDLVILAMGMNDGTDVVAFTNNFTSFYNYSQTWTKKPWFTLNACYLPIPTLPPYDTFQIPGQAIADTLRSLSLINGFGLIDPNAIYRYLHDGVSREYIPQVQEGSFRYWGDATKWFTQNTNPITIVSGTATINNNLAIRSIYARDIDVLVDFKPAATSAVTRISYRMQNDTDTISGYSVQWNNSAGGTVELYFGAGLVASATGVGFTAGVLRTMRVKASGELHEIYLDNFKLITYTNTYGMSSGHIALGYPAGGGTAKPALLYAADQIIAPSLFTHAEIMGITNDIFTNPDSIGGNGINHLSTLGTHLVYVHAARDWVQDLKGVLNRPRVSFATDASGITYSNAAYAAIPGCSITQKIYEDSTVRVDISLGYKNTGSSVGRVQLVIDGSVAETWTIPAEASPPSMRTFNATYIGQIFSGSHTYLLQWAIGNFSSGADFGSTRYFAVTAQ